jgi:TPR repeat protein
LSDAQVREVAQDNAEMATWYRRAGEPEKAAAPSAPGLSEAQDRGVAQDNAEMEKWYRKAAE